MLDYKIDIVVQSKYPEILDSFKSTFIPTTKQFRNLRLIILDGKDYGAPAINRLIGEAIKARRDYFGVFNDDLFFVDGWLEDTLKMINKYKLVVGSPGYIETKDYAKFMLAIEATKDEECYQENLYGPTAIYQVPLFKQIGLFDEQFRWSCDDLDWAWRIKLNLLNSGTSRKITTMHQVGITRDRGPREWRQRSKIDKQRFYRKHGYYSYNTIRDSYRKNHIYFSQFL